MRNRKYTLPMLSATIAAMGVQMPSQALPLANCERCVYRDLDKGGDAHCYMFQVKPGDRCSQMKEKH